jgi:hypothetical protein
MFKNILAFAAVLLVAGLASAQAQIGQGLPSQGPPGYYVSLKTSNSVATYQIGNAFPMSLIGFTHSGGAFSGTLYACDTSTTITPFTGCELITQLNAGTGDIAATVVQTAKRYFILNIIAAETLSPGSLLVIKGTNDQVAEIDTGKVAI